MKSIKTTAALACLLILAPAVHAIPVTWTTDDLRMVALINGSLVDVFASGSFVYDADTNVLSDISFSTPAGQFFEQCFPPQCDPAGLLLTDLFGGTSYNLGGVAVFPTPGTVMGLNFYNSVAVADGLLGDPLLRLNTYAPLTNAGGIVNVAGVELVCPTVNCQGFDITQHTFRYVYSGTLHSVPAPGVVTLLAIGLLFLSTKRRRSLR